MFLNSSFLTGKYNMICASLSLEGMITRDVGCRDANIYLNQIHPIVYFLLHQFLVRFRHNMTPGL